MAPLNHKQTPPLLWRTRNERIKKISWVIAWALAGLRGAELARLAGVDTSTVSRLESSRVKSVRGQAETVDRVIHALLRRGVRITDDGVMFVRKPRG